MLLAQNLQEIPANFTGISPQIMLLHGFPIVSPQFIHDFPTANVGYPHSIPVKSNSLQISQQESECGDFKITGIAGNMQSPVNPSKNLQCIYNIETQAQNKT